VLHSTKRYTCTCRDWSYRTKLKLLPFSFGGTNGQSHYNDTWAFDVAMRTWSKLNCIGFLPAAREGHAAALVDDIMYVFGGRGVGDKDLGDLAALQISSASTSFLSASAYPA
jgi:hypothetical protein